MQFLEILCRFKEIRHIDSIANIDKRELLSLMGFCDQQAQLFKREMLDDVSHYEQLHINATLPTSMTMSMMSNAIYGSCEMWMSFNKMVAYNVR